MGEGSEPSHRKGGGPHEKRVHYEQVNDESDVFDPDL